MHTLLPSSDETIYLLLLDMSKAFDTMRRKDLLEDLKTIVNEEELFLYGKLLNIKLAVRCGQSLSPFFITDTGGPQGECSSAKNFTLYLANSLVETTEENSDASINSNPTTDPLDPNQNHLFLELLYADDINEISNNPAKIKAIEETYPTILARRGLNINSDKTEKFTISRNNPDKTWKRCKLLGSLLDTAGDIKRRKSLAIDATKTVKMLFNNKKLWKSTKASVFDTYVSSVFLYNACTWTLTKSQEHQIDSFQRRLIRTNVLNVTWPDIVKNEDVYRLSEIRPWSTKIKKQRMIWLGHLLRMKESTPVRKALKFAEEAYQKPRGKPKLTWSKLVKEQLESEMEITWNEAKVITQDRKRWRTLVQGKYY